ncbi:hypothetical protein VTN00DRAFT_3627 [Thermoascus crustaceus]|uniref:uncharacterized protein n=1 Tax=Thermoascus crustaceus TaxID=5088 RepID=UPI00374354D0
MEMSDKGMHRVDGLPSNQSNALEEVLITGEQDGRPIDLASVLEGKMLSLRGAQSHATGRCRNGEQSIVNGGTGSSLESQCSGSNPGMCPRLKLSHLPGQQGSNETEFLKREVQ